MSKSLLLSTAVFVFISSLSVNSSATTVLDFDDLSPGYILTGSGYAGLIWEQGNEGYGERDESNLGLWVVPEESQVPGEDTNHPYSEPHNIINAYGCTLIGIQFPETVNVLGAYFAEQGSGGSVTGVRVHGFLNGSETDVTDWFNNIDPQPDWFNINLMNVDRIVVEAMPVAGDWAWGWYGMDNFTYEIVPEPATLSLLALGVVLMRKR